MHRISLRHCRLALGYEFLRMILSVWFKWYLIATWTPTRFNEGYHWQCLRIGSTIVRDLFLLSDVLHLGAHGRYEWKIWWCYLAHKFCLIQCSYRPSIIQREDCFNMFIMSGCWCLAGLQCRVHVGRPWPIVWVQLRLLSTHDNT